MCDLAGVVYYPKWYPKNDPKNYCVIKLFSLYKLGEYAFKK